MSTASLAYLGVRSDKLEDWNDFACNLLGMQQVDRGGKSLSYRMDDFEQRLLVSDEPGDTLSFMGWEVAGEDDLEGFATKLDAAGVEVEWGSSELADRRFVERLLVCHDPDGNRVELVWKPMRTSEPFVPGRTISGFKTGPLGMGHAVLHVTDIEKQLAFYRDLLGFELTDFGNMPLVPIHFLHVNGRHHSLAMIASGQKGFHHFMVEFQSLDDVGQGYDLAGASGRPGGLHPRPAHQRLHDVLLRPDALRLLRRERLGRPDHRPGDLAARRVVRRSEPLGPRLGRPAGRRQDDGAQLPDRSRLARRPVSALHRLPVAVRAGGEDVARRRRVAPVEASGPCAPRPASPRAALRDRRCGWRAAGSGGR